MVLSIPDFAFKKASDKNFSRWTRSLGETRQETLGILPRMKTPPSKTPDRPEKPKAGRERPSLQKRSLSHPGTIFPRRKLSGVLVLRLGLRRKGRGSARNRITRSDRRNRYLKGFSSVCFLRMARTSPKPRRWFSSRIGFSSIPPILRLRSIGNTISLPGSKRR